MHSLQSYEEDEEEETQEEQVSYVDIHTKPVTAWLGIESLSHWFLLFMNLSFNKTLFIWLSLWSQPIVCFCNSELHLYILVSIFFEYQHKILSLS